MLSVFHTNLDFLRFEEGGDREGNWKPGVVMCSSVQMDRQESEVLPLAGPLFPSVF